MKQKSETLKITTIIEVKTVPGHALDILKMFKTFIIGFNKVQYDCWTSKKDDCFCIRATGSPIQILNIQKNAILKEQLEGLVLGNKSLNKYLVNQEDKVALTRMLKENTRIRVYRTGEQEEKDNDGLNVNARLLKYFVKQNV